MAIRFFYFRDVFYTDPRRHGAKTLLVDFIGLDVLGVLEIDEDSVPFVLEQFEELWNVRLFKAHVFAVVFQDGLNFAWREVRKVEYFSDLCLDCDGFAAVFEINGICW